MHVFLTGEIQIGKSTVIAKTLALLNCSPAGFKTYFGPDRGFGDKLLYMNSIVEPEIYREENAIVRFRKGYQPHAITEKFNIYGVELIRAARASTDLIIMDECGDLERNALVFQKEIVDTLDGDIPVFGVIKRGSRGWTDYLRVHPKGELITVTRENRDYLPQILADSLILNLKSNKYKNIDIKIRGEEGNGTIK